VGYIWLFRSLPLIVLIIPYNFSYLYDTLSLACPLPASPGQL
jgi:polar amino acid transport system permease protein